MCGSKRRAAAYNRYPPALGTVDPASGPYYGRRGCGQGRCGPGLIRKLVTKAIENRNKKMEARQQLEAAHQVPQRSNLPDLEKQESAVLQERHPRAQPVKVVFDDGHEEYISTNAKEQELEYETEAQPQRGEQLPRYSEVMKA
ncbi:hypothetical protein FJTKL_09374 [Diaporthe vaccinii]|uniref:Uncharacterized protein n=1 Tax=Diaporthe vaccinii TaxID=105482 RepID=A0ABR4FCH3_9PEZI